MTTRKIGRSWWVDITHDRKRHRKKSPDNSKAGAEVYEAYLRRKLAEGVSLDRVHQQSKQEQTFEEFSQVWFKTYVVVNNKPSEIVRKKSVLKNKLNPFFGKTSLNQITTLQVEQYKAQMVERGYGSSSINCQISVLRKCLRDAQEWLELEKIPRIKKLQLPPDKHDFFTKAECGRLLDQMEGLWRDIVFTAMKTGLRIGEMRALRWQDVQWNNRTIQVRHTWCQTVKDLVSPKGKKERTIPLTHDVCSLLSARRLESGFVFGNEYGGIFSDQRLNKEIGTACERAGLRKITCHVLRHTFASHLAMAGAPLGAIQNLLGHSDVKETMRYAHLSRSSIKETVGLLEEPFLSISPREAHTEAQH